MVTSFMISYCDNNNYIDDQCLLMPIDHDQIITNLHKSEIILRYGHHVSNSISLPKAWSRFKNGGRDVWEESPRTFSMTNLLWVIEVVSARCSVT